MEIPRSRSSGSRSVSTPVSARTSHVLPWSMWPAVPRTSCVTAVSILALWARFHAFGAKSFVSRDNIFDRVRVGARDPGPPLHTRAHARARLAPSLLERPPRGPEGGRRLVDLRLRQRTTVEEGAAVAHHCDDRRVARPQR